MPESSLGQLLLTGVPGPVLDAETAATFRRLQPGGFIYRFRGQFSGIIDLINAAPAGHFRAAAAGRSKAHPELTPPAADSGRCPR